MDIKLVDDVKFDISDFTMGDEAELEFSIGDFDIATAMKDVPTRYVKPKFLAKPLGVDYQNAVKLARDIKLHPGEQVHAIVRGDFVYGDFIEALVYEKNVIVKDMYLSTLSLSQENVDSLAGMLRDGRIEKLNIILSNYFYSHEKWRLIPYMLKELDIEDRFDLMIIRNHTKFCLMEVANIKLVMSGSANLRSSNCFEQFVLQESPELHAFYRAWCEEQRPYSIINKEVSK